MNPATNAKPNNGTLKILIASLPTHSYEHTHTQKTPKTVIKQQSNNAYKLFITWHEFKPSFCLLLLLTAAHVVSPCSFCFLFCVWFLQPNLISTPESVPTLPSFLRVSSGGSGAADFPLLCPPPVEDYKPYVSCPSINYGEIHTYGGKHAVTRSYTLPNSLRTAWSNSN